MLPLGHGQVGPAQPVGPVEAAAFRRAGRCPAPAPRRPPAAASRGGSTASTIACRFRVASAGEQLPPTAVTATTSSPGCNRRKTQGQRVVHARINVEDHFSRHDFSTWSSGTAADPPGTGAPACGSWVGGRYVGIILFPKRAIARGGRKRNGNLLTLGAVPLKPEGGTRLRVRERGTSVTGLPFGLRSFAAASTKNRGFQGRIVQSQSAIKSIPHLPGPARHGRFGHRLHRGELASRPAP